MPSNQLRGARAAAIVVACAGLGGPTLAADLPGRNASNMAQRCYEYAAARDGGYSALAACDGAFRIQLNRRERTATYVNRALVRGARGDYDGALDDLDSAGALAPDLASVQVARGEMLVQLGRWHDAETAYTSALDLGATSPERVHFGRALAREGAGDLDGAEADYRAAARLAPEWDAPQEQLERFEPGRTVRRSAKA